MKKIKRSRTSLVQPALRPNSFRVEPLEPRVLLSADPVFSPIAMALAADRQDIQSLTEAYSAKQNSTNSVSVPLMSRLLSNPAAISAAQTFAVDATLFDIGQLSMQSGLVGGAVRVAPRRRTCANDRIRSTGCSARGTSSSPLWRR
jgi:hypothetical protein